MLHLTGRGRESEAMRHPYLAALRQFLQELLPRPLAVPGQAPAAAAPAKGALCERRLLAGQHGAANPGVSPSLQRAILHTPACAAVGASPFLRTPASSAKRQADAATRGSTLYSVLLEFWLTDGDEPVPATGTGAPAAASARGAPMWCVPACPCSRLPPKCWPLDCR